MSTLGSSQSPEQPEAGGSSSKTKPMRKQGVSCDACKFRKVKCDRRVKLENKGPQQNPDDVACSICTAHGLRCTFTQSAPRRRRGKRIVAIQQEQQDEQEDTLALRSQQEEETLRRGAARGPLLLQDPEGPLFGYNQTYQSNETAKLHYAAEEMARKAQEQSKARQKAKHEGTDPRDNLSKQGLFGVRGLTRALLDACVRSYFKYAAPCQPILHAEIFSARYRLFFTLFEEYQGIPPPSASPPVGFDDRPLSLLVILAVGTVGAGLLEAPIAEPGSRAKFRLQDRMALRFHEVLREGSLVMRLRDEGADVIEACYIMSDPCFKVLRADELTNTTNKPIDWSRVAEKDTIDEGPYTDPLQLNASSAEAVARLIFKMNINRSPRPRKDVAEGDKRKWTNGAGALLTEHECFRRIRIFWSAFIQDSFRSFGMRIPLHIGDDDYDLDLPRLVSRRDGFYTALIFHHSEDKKGFAHPGLPPRTHVPRGDQAGERKAGTSAASPAAPHLEPRNFARFDALILELLLRLAFIIRSASIRFVSHRSQGRGVLCSDIERAVSCLTIWRDQLPVDVQWGSQCAPLLQARQQDPNVSLDSPKYAILVRHSIKALFLEGLYDINILSLWSAVAEYGIRFEIDMSESLRLLASQLGLQDNSENDKAKAIRTQNALTAAQEALKSDPATAETRKKAAQANLDDLLMKRFLRAAPVARQAGQLRLARSNRLLFLNLYSGFIAFGLAFAKKVANVTPEAAPFPVPPGVHPSEHLLACANDYIFALSTIDSHEDVEEMVEQLNKEHGECTAFCKEARSSMHASGLSELDGSPAETSGSTDASNKTTPTSTTQSPGDNLTNGSSPHSASNNLNYSAMQPNDQTVHTRYMPPGAPSVLSHMDVDEVAMLARAAMPANEPNTSSANGWIAQLMADREAGRNTSQPQDNINSLYGPGLDLDLESVTGMDTQWLNEYLQDQNAMNGHDMGNAGFNGNMQQQAYSSVPSSTNTSSDSTFIAKTAGLGESSALPPSDPMSSFANSFPPEGYQARSGAYNMHGNGNYAPSASTYGNGMPDYSAQANAYDNFNSALPQQSEPFSQPVFPSMTDEQWQNFVGGVDAQDWATSHWQGAYMPTA